MSFGCQTRLVCFALCVLATPTLMIRIKLKGIQCQNLNPKLGIIKQCIIKVYNREIKELHFYMTLLQKPVSNVTVGKPFSWLYQHIHICISLNSYYIYTYIISIYTYIYMKLQMHLDIKRRFRSTSATFDIDVCRFFRSTKRNPIANAVYSFFHLQIYSNINHTCPYDVRV